MKMRFSIIAAACAVFCSVLGAETKVDRADYLHVRGGIARAMKQMKDGKATVAFIGGSITEMNGYSKYTEEGLRAIFPKCAFSFVNAGIASTCSDTGAFRLERDVLSRGPIDLLFVEFATNDSYDGTYPSTDKSLKAMEGIVRRARGANPRMDVVFLYTATEAHLKDYREGKVPVAIQAHEKVAAHYGLASINFSGEVFARMQRGEFDWKKFGGTHPAPFGNRIYADDILALVRGELNHVDATPHAEVAVLTKGNYANARFVPVSAAKCGAGWSVGVPDWKKIPGGKRSTFTREETLFSETPGAAFTFDFSGSAIALFLTAGIDAGEIEYQIDGGAARTVDLFHTYSTMLHYPYTLTLANDLAEGPHTLSLRVAAGRNAKSQGHAVRIMKFCVNAR